MVGGIDGAGAAGLRREGCYPAVQMLLSLVLLMAAGAEPGEEERDLMRQIAAGSEEAFMALYRRHSPVVLGLLTRIVRDRAAAEDLLQEVFLTLWRRRALCDPAAGSVLPWLLVVARHRAFDRLRSAAHRHEKTAAGSEEFARMDPPDPAADFEPGIWQAFDLERAKAALAALTSQERQSLELAYFEGLTQAEVSARLGQPLGTVKTWMRNGLAKLRHSLAPTTP